MNRREIIKCAGALLLPLSYRKPYSENQKARSVIREETRMAVANGPRIIDAFIDFCCEVHAKTGERMEKIELPPIAYNALIEEGLPSKFVGIDLCNEEYPRIAGVKVTMGWQSDYGDRMWQTLAPALRGYALMHGGSVRIAYWPPMQTQAVKSRYEPLRVTPMPQIETIRITVER